MVTDIKKIWETRTVDCPSASAAAKVATLRGGESILMTSLAARDSYHYMSYDGSTSLARSYKLFGEASISIDLPKSFGTDNFIEIWALPGTAGEDITYSKVINTYDNETGEPRVTPIPRA